MKQLVLNKKDYIFRKMDNVYIALYFSDGNSHMFDDVGTLLIDMIERFPIYDEALQKSCEYFGENISDFAKEFNIFVERMKDLNLLIENNIGDSNDN